MYRRRNSRLSGVSTANSFSSNTPRTVTPLVGNRSSVTSGESVSSGKGRGRGRIRVTVPTGHRARGTQPLTVWPRALCARRSASFDRDVHFVAVLILGIDQGAGGR